MILNPANKYQIIRQRQFKSSSISLWSKSFGNIIFSRAEKNKTKKMRQLNVQTFIYYLIYSGARKAFHKIIKH